MHHTNRRLPSAARWMVGALAALLPLATYALGLGKLTVRSALNEPLNAEIEITSIVEKELKGLQVGLAPRADFEQAGVERLPFLSDIKFNVSKRADGNYFIQLLTDRQIEEPFLHLLLALEWPGGKMVREYTALIDPPVQATGKPAGIDVPMTTATPEPAVTPIPTPAEPVPEPVATLEPKEEPAPVQPPMAEQPVAEPAPVESMPAEAEPLAAPSEAPAPEPTSPSSTTTATVEPLEPKSTPTPRTSASVAAGWAMEGGYKVNRGDTAWRIAESLRTDDKHTIEQIVLALYRTNPRAFFENNVNNLKAGQILKVPESAEIEAVVPVEARTQFRAQYDAWQEYKIKLAGASGAIKVVDAEPKPAAAPAETKPAAVAKPEAAKKEPEKVAAAPVDKAKQDEMLKIVRSTMQGDKTTPDKKPAEGEAKRGAKEQQSLADRVAMTEESLASKQMESKEIGEKLAQVRAQLKRESRLIQIEQEQLAAAQAKAQPKPAEPAPAPKVEAPAKPEPAPAPKAEAPKPAEPPAVAPAPTPAPAPSKPAPTVAQKPPAPAPAAPPAEETSFVDDLLASVMGGDSLMPIVLGVVVLFSGGIAFVYMNRRRKSIAEFEESILQSEGITGGDAAVTTDTSGQVVSTGDTSFLSDFSQGGMGNIHTDEVDPIAEAEVYLAYGRDETAEEILKEAMVKNPAREEIKLKLLEIYANRSDVRAFETLAEEMYASLGGRPSKNWPRVEELGRKLNPNNPMFKGGGGGGMGAAPASVAAAPAALGFADTAKMKATLPPSTSVMDTQTGLTPPPSGGATMETAGGFDYDMNVSAPAASEDVGFDLDMGAGDAGTKSEGDAIDFSVDLGKSDGGLDLDLGQADSNAVDFDFGGKEEPAMAGAPATELAMAEAPVAAAEGGESPQWDETATKLDLARAYVDMGDAEGARSILDEVMAEGNDQQKKQAKELAAQLG